MVGAATAGAGTGGAAQTKAAARLIGIDWGSSSRRAYVIDGGGRCLHRIEDEEGALAARGRYAASLDGLLARLESECGPASVAGLPVVMSGMVGGAQGWQEVPYIDCGTPLASLPAALVTVLDGRPGHACHIVPGYRCGAGAEVDVMRGEETQLLGAAELGLREGWAVLPGTHSKWVQLRDGAINSLSTFMTGELFAMLQAGGTLAPLMAAARAPAGSAATAAAARGAASGGLGSGGGLGSDGASEGEGGGGGHRSGLAASAGLGSSGGHRTGGVASEGVGSSGDSSGMAPGQPAGSRSGHSPGIGPGELAGSRSGHSPGIGPGELAGSGSGRPGMGPGQLAGGSGGYRAGIGSGELAGSSGGYSDALAAGAMHARRHPPLTHALFSVRARVVTGAMPAAHARDYVSGLLIGSEFVAAQDAGFDGAEPLTLIGAPALAARYGAVAALFDLSTIPVDPHRAYCAALRRFLAARPDSV
ncbi:2-dehydro-3-deoxygalactonokinase [Pseudoduganella sp. LjRoot289]|uniref:2-dehydro-3-deoxygalactonokinase n=1 Tax=Pseudoduganella sp. LjRoot289 TaxID=3342314 RepID=UPI003ECFB5CE